MCDCISILKQRAEAAEAKNARLLEVLSGHIDDLIKCSAVCLEHGLTKTAKEFDLAATELKQAINGANKPINDSRQEK